MVIADGVYTVAAFEHFCRLYETQDHLFELIQGRIVEKLPTEEHGLLVSNLGYALHHYVKQAKNGRIGCHVAHRMPQDDYNVRMPDLAFSNVRRPLIRTGYVPHMPALAVDIQLPDVSAEALRAKATYYLENGARLVWLVYPEKRLVEAYRLAGDVEILLEGDSLDGGEVLPDFTLLVADVFADV